MQSLDVSTAPSWDPQHPATRIYVQGFTYKLVAPRIVHPPLANTVKMIMNWATSAGRVAKNIMYGLFGSSVDTTNVTTLKAVAEALLSTYKAAGFGPGQHSNITLQNVTVKDNSGASSNQATSTGSPYTGTGTAAGLPPQCAIVISWSIGASYRGGKPRTYLPGIDQNALANVYDSLLNAGLAATLTAAANAWSAAFNSSSPAGHDVVMGTISYQRNHVALPAPVFHPFGAAHIHERLDSQRRRSGRESLFPVTP